MAADNDKKIQGVKNPWDIEIELPVSKGELTTEQAPAKDSPLKDPAAALGAFVKAGGEKPATPAPNLVLDRRGFRRVVVMFHGRLNDLKTVREQLNQAQTQLFEQFGEKGLLIKLAWMLDDITNYSNWSHSPQDVGQRTNLAHCYQGLSDYGRAFGDNVKRGSIGLDNENLRMANIDDRVDAVFVVGNKFDENAEAMLPNMELLKKQGTKIFFCQYGNDRKTTEAFSTLAAANGGVFVKVQGAKSIATILPALVDYLKNGNQAAQKLLAGPNTELRDIGKQLLLKGPK